MSMHKHMALAIATLSISALAENALPAADGKEVFLAQHCDTCHAVSTAGIEATTKSEKMKGPDLAGVVQRHDAEWIKQFLHKEIDKDGKKHGKEFKGTAEELATIVAWLEAQKKV